MKLTVSHDFLPKTRSVRAAQVMDHFGIGFETGRHVIADGLELPIDPGDVVLFTGASGSGKSSLMRAAAQELSVESRELRVREDGSHVLDIDQLRLPDCILVDAIDLPFEESLPLLASCGLGESHLLLRTPAELSDGQRYRFRLALAVSHKPRWIFADEFTATLDRTLAKVIAFNVRRIADRTGIGFLLATTHEDVAVDLSPSLHVRCRLEEAVHWLRSDGSTGGNDSQSRHRKPVRADQAMIQVKMTAERSPTPMTHHPMTPSPNPPTRRFVSFANELSMTIGGKSDWPYFARWHYRSHHLGFTKFVTLLWHGEEPVGICVFTAPAISLRQRGRFFGLSGRWSRVKLQALNRQLVTLSRVVLHPTYRGAGIASRFIRRSCEASGYPWIEVLAQMGHVNPVFERAGFQRVGVTRSAGRTRAEHSEIYGGNRRRGPRRLVSRETSDKSRYAEPVYYVFDNRRNAERNDAG
jgi:uncharacterized protein